MVALLLTAGTAHAGTPKASGAMPLENMPDSPAFVALGVVPTEVMRPTTISGLAIDLGSAFSGDGTLQPGLALEANPLWLALGKGKSASDWRKEGNGPLRLASHTTFSVATSQASADAPSKTSTGVKIALVDKSDSRWDEKYASCAQSATSDALNTVTVPGQALDVDARARLDETIRKCWDESEARMEKGGVVTVAGALVHGVEGTAWTLDEARGWLLGDPGGTTDFLFTGQYHWRAATGDHELSAGLRWGLEFSAAQIGLVGAYTPVIDTDSLFGSEALRLAADGQIDLGNGAAIVGAIAYGLGADSASPGITSSVNLKFGSQEYASL